MATLTQAMRRAPGALQAVRWSPPGLWVKHWPNLLTAALLALFCWLLAQWLWYFLQPQAAAGGTTVSQPMRASINPAAATGLFGTANASAKPLVQEVALSSLNAQLKGVFAELGRFPAFAIVNINGKDEGVKVGEELMPGIVLDSVHADHIVLRRGASMEKIEFPQSAAAALSGGSPAPVAMAPRGGPQFQLNVQNQAPNTLAFSRAQLQNSLQDMSQLANLGRVGPSAAGGVMMEEVPPGSLAEKLGLRAGDVVRQINGQAVNSPADLMRLYQEFDEVSTVQVNGMRSGRPLQLTYNVQQ